MVYVIRYRDQMLSAYGEANHVNIDGYDYWEVLPEYPRDAGGDVFQAQSAKDARKALATGNFKGLELLA